MLFWHTNTCTLTTHITKHIVWFWFFIRYQHTLWLWAKIFFFSQKPKLSQQKAAHYVHLHVKPGRYLFICTCMYYLNVRAPWFLQVNWNSWVTMATVNTYDNRAETKRCHLLGDVFCSFLIKINVTDDASSMYW